MTFSFIDVKVPGDASQNNKPQMLMNAYQSTNQPAPLLEQATPEMYDIISKELDRVKDFDVDTIIEQRSKYINQQNLNEGAHHVVLAAAGAAVAHHLGHDPVHGAAIGATLPMATRLAAGTALVGGAAAGAAAIGAGKGVHHIIKKGVEHFHKKVTVPYHKKQADHHEKMRDHHANHDEADDDDHSYKAELHHDAHEKHKAAMKDHSKSSEAKAATAKVHAKKYKYDQGDHAKLMGRNESFNEGLKGDQHKLDHDNDGDIDGKDFEMLRMKKKKKKMDSPTKNEPEGENGDTAEMNPKMKDKEKKMEKKESKIREALLSVLERSHGNMDSKETMDDMLKGGGAKKMKADMMKGAKMNNTVAKAPEDAKAAGSRGPSAKPRNSGDNIRKGDTKIVQGGTPMKDPSSPKQRLESIMNAYASMQEKTHMMTVDGYTSQGEPNAHKKFNVTKKVHKGPDGKRIEHGYGGYKVSFHGSKENLAKYNDHHFDNEEKIVKKDGVKSEATVYENISYHKAMAKAHDEHSRAHESEVTNDGHEDHDYAGTDHGEAEKSHKIAASAFKKHGATSQQYKSAAATAHKHSKIAHETSDDAGPFKKTAKPGIKFPKKISEQTINELSKETLKKYAVRSKGDSIIKRATAKRADREGEKQRTDARWADRVLYHHDREGGPLPKGMSKRKLTKYHDKASQATTDYRKKSFDANKKADKRDDFRKVAKGKAMKKYGESFSGTGVGTLGNIMDAYQSMNQQKSLNEEMHHIMNHVKNHDFKNDTVYSHEKHYHMVKNLQKTHISVSLKHRECADKLATDPHHGPGHPLHMAHHEAADAHEKANKAHADIMNETNYGRAVTSRDDENFHKAMSASHEAAGKSSETHHIAKETR